VPHLDLVQWIALCVGAAFAGFSKTAVSGARWWRLAHSAGAIMTVYLLLSGVTMLEFLGTGAWFFFIVNLLKLPFSIQLGLVHVTSLQLDLALLPALGVGAAVGVALIKRIRQQHFERIAAVSAVALLI
jgi:hypothetical protein